MPGQCPWRRSCRPASTTHWPLAWRDCMPAPDFIVAIPARHDASRLPGKPLRLIAGEPMVVHVARRALAAGATEVIVATDDERIAEAVRGYPVRVCMTRREHPSGTDRLAECARQLSWPPERIVVNLQ